MRKPYEIESDIDELDARYAAAIDALKFSSHDDPQRAEWQAIVNEYGSKKTNLIAELRSVNGRARG